jgi:hypothetical protein
VNGLRVYINPAEVDPRGGHRVFYSRRADGPYYRWQFEEARGQWHGARVRLSDVTLRLLNIASWQAVPPILQARLDGHYLE